MSHQAAGGTMPVRGPLRIRNARRRMAAVAAALALASSLGVAAPPVRAAAGVTFGTPNVTAAFLSGISIAEPVTLPADVRRLEALVRTEGSVRTLVTPVALPGPGSPVLHYELTTPSGGLLPNTQVQLGFRVTLADGTTVDGPLASFRYDDTRYAWQTLSGRLVRVHWVQGGDAFGRQALAIAERAVGDAATLLGVDETEPIDFFVYADRTAFYDVLGPAARENVGAAAFPDIRTVFANISTTDPNDPVVGIYIPHELTHIVFGDATANPYHEPLHWLNEGLAVYLSQGYDPGSRSSVTDAASNHTLMPLTALAGQFPTQGDRFALAYDESVSAVDFLVRHFGRDALVRLITTYATGVSDDAAFNAGIGVDQAEFEVAWLADLGAPPPSPFGPKPAPAGPVPSDWLAGAGSGSSAGPAPSGGGGADVGGGIDATAVLELGAALLVIVGLLVARNVITARRESSSDENPKPW